MTTINTFKDILNNYNELNPQQTADLKKYLNENAFHVWGIEDVLELDETLTKEQAIEILQYAENNTDCEFGFTWNYLEDCIENWKAENIEEEEEEEEETF